MMRYSQLEEAILQTIAYGDIFKYPLTLGEIYRYMIGTPATLPAIQGVLRSSDRLNCLVSRRGPYYTLRSREEIIQTRLKRAVVAASLWPKAVHYGRLISQTPFVRLVAVTGSLAMNNTDPGADIDYLVVTQAGRLWLARGMVILLVRLAARQGVGICPNYFLSDQALVLKDQNMYSAHELTQMVPLSGRRLYAAIREKNRWVYEYLPNTRGAPNVNIEPEDQISFVKVIGEGLTNNSAGSWLERWEMKRKLRKFQPYTTLHPEASFGPDWCKGHADDHEVHTLNIYYERLQSLEGAPL